MNKRRGIEPLYLHLLFLLILAACGSTPNKGIEVGNPDLKGKVLTLTPKDRPETYLLDFEEDGDVTATRILENAFETVPAALEVEESSALVTASFADSTFLEVALSFDEAGQIVDTELFLDGQPVELESSSLAPKTFKRPNFEEAALGVAAELCSRLVECAVETETESCTQALFDVPGLAASLGGKGNQTVRELQEELAAGTVVPDESSLETCFWEITQMPCPQVRQAGPATDPLASQNIRKMIPLPSCAQGFR